MNEILLGLLTLAGVAVGAYLQHIFGKSRKITENADLRRYDAYAQFLSGVAQLASGDIDGNTKVADAKSRISVYGSTRVINELAKFARTDLHLRNESTRDAFVSVVQAMRDDGLRTDKPIDRQQIIALLFNIHDDE